MVTCYLGIGSNLGDREKNIRLALQKVNGLKGTKIIKVSKITETKAVGGPGHQGKFLNAALKIKTHFSPLMLLKKLKKIEKQLGRTRNLRHGPRTIDLDILFFGDKIINRKNLKIPHPKVFKREFVIRPLEQIL